MVLTAILGVAIIVILSVKWVDCIDKDIQYRQEHPEYDPDDDDFWPPMDDNKCSKQK